MSSPCEALRVEATVNSMRCVILQNIAKSTEKAIHLTEDHPIRITFEGFFRSRLKRRNERSEVEKLCKELGEHRCALFIFLLLNHGKIDLEKFISSLL